MSKNDDFEIPDWIWHGGGWAGFGWAVNEVSRLHNFGTEIAVLVGAPFFGMAVGAFLGGMLLLFIPPLRKVRW